MPGHARCEREDLGRLEPAALRDDLQRARSDVRRAVDAGPVRHRRGVDDRFPEPDGIDVGKVAERHREQVAVREHHALRPAGRAARVEEPGEIVGRGVGDGELGVAGEGAVLVAPDRDRAFQPRHARGERADRRRVLGIDEAHAGARVVEDVLGFLRMELGVDRHEREAGPPGGPRQLDIGRAVGHEQRDPVARSEPEPRAQRGAEPGARARKSAIVGDHALAERERRRVREDAPGPREEDREVHGFTRRRPGAQTGCFASMAGAPAWRRRGSGRPGGDCSGAGRGGSDHAGKAGSPDRAGRDRRRPGGGGGRRIPAAPRRPIQRGGNRLAGPDSGPARGVRQVRCGRRSRPARACACAPRDRTGSRRARDTPRHGSAGPSRARLRSGPKAAPPWR